MNNLSLFDPPQPPGPGETCPTCGHRRAVLSDLNAKPRAHRDGPATERTAAALAWPKAGNSRHKILLALLDAGEHGRTFAELERELAMFSARQRLNDLKAGGWTVTDGRTRDTPRGAPAEVHVLSPEALNRLTVAHAASRAAA